MSACTAAVLKDEDEWHYFLLLPLVGWQEMDVCWFIRTCFVCVMREREIHTEWETCSQRGRIWVTSCREWEDSTLGRVIFDKLCVPVMKRKVLLGHVCEWLLLWVCVRMATHTPKDIQNKGSEMKHVSRPTFWWIISLSGLSVHLSNSTLLLLSFYAYLLFSFLPPNFSFSRLRFLYLLIHCLSVTVSISLSPSFRLECSSKAVQTKTTPCCLFYIPLTFHREWIEWKISFYTGDLWLSWFALGQSINQASFHVFCKWTVCLQIKLFYDRLVIVCSVVMTHQQFPSRPCRMSEGRGVRKTDHLTPRSLKLLQLISWGRSHFLIRCWTLSPSGKPTDRGPGGKLSSTKLTAFWTRMTGRQWRVRERELIGRHRS